MMHLLVQLGELFARVSVGAILNSLWEGVALAVLAWLLLRSVPRGSASLRYGLWCAALVAVIALPVAALHPFAGPAANAAATGAEPPVLVPQRLAQLMFALWYIVATALLLRLIISYVRLQQLKASARPIPTMYQHRVRRWLEESGGHRECRLCLSDKVPMPVAIGLFDPVIVLPERLLEQLSDDELDQVGLHELAHLQRWDDYTNVFQKIAEALLFFNPAVYFIGRQLTLEREIACDDRVIAATRKPLTYAACLTRLVEETALARQSLPALGAVSTRRQIAIRIERLLDKRRALPLASGLAALAACCAIVAGLVTALHARPLVGIAPDYPSSQPRAARIVAEGPRSADLIARILVTSQRPAAHAAVTASTFPVIIVRRIDVDMRRVHAVARSNAVGTRNFIISTVRVEAPRDIPVAQFTEDSHIDVHVAAHAESTATAESAASAASMASDNDLAPTATTLATTQSEIAALTCSLKEAQSAISRMDALRALSQHVERAEARAAIVAALLHDSSPLVQLQAVHVLAKDAGHPDSQAGLVEALRTSDSSHIKVIIISLLADKTHDAQVRKGLTTALLGDGSVHVQIAAVEALAPVADDPEVRAALEEAGGYSTSNALRLSIRRVLAQFEQR
jgi:beta-lactamase regulating signal transducer with metallopeptidase domain